MRDLRQPRHAAREGFRPDRRAEGGQARRAQGEFSRSRGARCWHSVRPVSRDRPRPPLQEHRQDRVPVDGRELPQTRGDAGRVEGSGAGGRATARRNLLDGHEDRPRAAVPRATACRDGEGIRRRLPRWRVHPLRHQRRGPAGIHRGRAEPDALQHRRLRQHREGHPRGLGLAVHAACLGVAPGAHERARAHLSRGAAAADGAVRHVRRDDHAGCGQRRSQHPVGGRQRRCRRSGRRSGGRIGAHRQAHWQRAPDGLRHLAAPHGSAGDGRHRQAACVGCRDFAEGR